MDNNQNFAGAWATYRPKKGQALDAYYLFLDNTNRGRRSTGSSAAPFTPAHVRRPVRRRPGRRAAVRLRGGDAARQPGRAGRVRRDGDGRARATTSRTRRWTPTVWAYYDYASGDDDPNGGTVHTFNQLFPFGHYYFGWIDLVGRQNIHDLNFHLYLYPTKWITVVAAVPQLLAGGGPGRPVQRGRAGDPPRPDRAGPAATSARSWTWCVNFHLTKHADLLTGYSHLFGGDFLKRTAGPDRGVDSGLYYLQLSYRW